MLDKITGVIKKTNYDIGFYITDMYGNEIKYNENQKFETASCIKIFILIEYFKQLNQGKISSSDFFVYTEQDNISGVNSGIISSLDYGLKLSS